MSRPISPAPRAAALKLAKTLVVVAGLMVAPCLVIQLNLGLTLVIVGVLLTLALACWVIWALGQPSTVCVQVMKTAKIAELGGSMLPMLPCANPNCPVREHQLRAATTATD